MKLSRRLGQLLLDGWAPGGDSPFVISAGRAPRVRFDSITFTPGGTVTLMYRGEEIGSVRSPMPLTPGSTLVLNGIEGTTAFELT